MKTIIRVITCAITLLIIQGCSSVVPIKTQVSNIKEVAKCVEDSNSHGQCVVGKTEPKKPILYAEANFPGSESSYFEALSVLQIPKQLDNEAVSFNKDSELGAKFKVYSEKFKSLDCESYNQEAAQMTKSALLSESNMKIHELYNNLLPKGSLSNNKGSTVEFSGRQFNKFLESLYEANINDGLISLQCVVNEKMKKVRSLGEMYEVGSLMLELDYTKEYFKAYFRHGKFLQGELEVGELYTKLRKEIESETKIGSSKSYLSEEQINSFVNGLFKKLTGKDYAKACPAGGDKCKVVFAGKLDPIQFVTRSGVEYGFPHVTVSVDFLAEKNISVSKIDWNKVGAEVAKVFIEAVGDKHIELPADPRSTACKVNNALCYSEKDGDIKSDQFASVGEHSDKLDALVSSAVGKSIRGAGWLSLNNEAIASIIETSIGTAAKKVAEKVAYCTYSCISKGQADVMSSMSLKEVSVKVTR